MENCNETEKGPGTFLDRLSLRRKMKGICITHAFRYSNAPRNLKHISTCNNRATLWLVSDLYLNMDWLGHPSIVDQDEVYRRDNTLWGMSLKNVEGYRM